MWTYISGVGSFLFLVFASWCVGEGGEILGEKYDASVIGGLVIAWLNTAPEAIFFISALESGNPRFAIGAVSGSTIVVCTVALGACLFIGARARKTRPITLQPGVKTQSKILLASLVVPALTCVYGFSFAVGVLGALFYLLFLVYSLRGKSAPPAGPHKDHSDLEIALVEEEEEDEEDDEHEEASTLKGIGYLVVGGFLIVFFSTPFIDAVVEVSSMWDISPTLLAFFLAPIASEAPEILESVSLSRKGSIQNINIAFSNLIGGTITKTTLLVGIFSFYGVSSEFAWQSPNYAVSLMLLSFSALVAGWIGGMVKRQTEEHGLILFAVFLVTAVVQYEYNSEFPQPEVLGMSSNA